MYTIAVKEERSFGGHEQSFHSITQQLAATCEFRISSGNQNVYKDLRKTLKLTQTQIFLTVYICLSVVAQCPSHLLTGRFGVRGV